jgi:hypothetical protein
MARTSARVVVRRRAAVLAQRAPQQKFDVPIQAAQFVVGPVLQSVEHGFVDPQKKRLPVSHENGAPAAGRRLDGY